MLGVQFVSVNLTANHQGMIQITLLTLLTINMSRTFSDFVSYKTLGNMLINVNLTAKIHIILGHPSQFVSDEPFSYRNVVFHVCAGLGSHSLLT